VHVHSWAELDGCVVLPEVDVGRHAKLRRVVVDCGVRIPEGLVVGEEPDLDARRFWRTGNGVCLITQATLDWMEVRGCRRRGWSAAAGPADDYQPDSRGIGDHDGVCGHAVVTAPWVTPSRHLARPAADGSPTSLPDPSDRAAGSSTSRADRGGGPPARNVGDVCTRLASG
jgi:hypothetical protein